ncbi:MAG: PaREP1 family protein [Thermoproteus sp.]
MYLAAPRRLWEEGTELLEAGDVRQASERLWNAVVQSVKAYAEVAGMPHEQTDTGRREEAGEGQRGDARLLAAVVWRNDPSPGRRNAATIHPTETLPPPHPACPAADSRPTGLADARSP